MVYSRTDPIPYTLLSLPRYAKILGISPVHFARATTSLSPTIWPATTCNDLWPRHSWQSGDRVSHEDLALAIQGAESDIAHHLGYWPAPMWISDEPHQYPRYHRTEYYGIGLDARGQYKALKANWGKFIQAGRRAVSLVGTATTAAGTLVYTDQDGDGYFETATITLPTTVTEECELKAFFAGEGGAQEWQIRPARSRAIAGGFAILVFDAWLFIDPDLQGAYPTDAGFAAIDISTTANYVTSVEVYREYTDFTQASAEFFWEKQPTNLIPVVCSVCGGAGCAACELTTQDGCLHVRDVDTGLVAPVPATYSANDAAWAEACWTGCREPDMVNLWYYAGDLDQRYLRGVWCDGLPDAFAQAIAWIATARLEREFCSCGNLRALQNDLRTDLAFSDGQGNYQVTADQLDNPFGTRKGEVMAWRRVGRLARPVPSVAVV